jgi:hypothetical protein
METAPVRNKPFLEKLCVSGLCGHRHRSASLSWRSLVQGPLAKQMGPHTRSLGLRQPSIERVSAQHLRGCSRHHTYIFPMLLPFVHPHASGKHSMGATSDRSDDILVPWHVLATLHGLISASLQGPRIRNVYGIRVSCADAVHAALLYVRRGFRLHKSPPIHSMLLPHILWPSR